MSASHEYRCCPHESAIRTSPITMGNADKGGSTALDSRSAVLHRAVRLLRTAGSGGAYEAAWEEWAAQGDGTLWESTTGDGLKS